MRPRINIGQFFGFSATSAAAAWGYHSTGNVLLLLATAWFASFFIFTTLGGFRLTGRIETRMARHLGILTPGELLLLVSVMSIFSFVGYSSIQRHWFMLAHGAWWSLVSLRQGWKFLMDTPYMSRRG